MSDSRRERNPRKIRVHLSGGIYDVQDVGDLIKDDRLANGWEMNWYQLKPRGDYGPLHDLQLGFIESID